MSKFLHDDDKNSKSKKGHNCAKNILRVTSPIGRVPLFIMNN